MLQRRALLAGLAPLPRAARAATATPGAIAIGPAWALPARHGDGQLFVPLLNRGSRPDALVAARSDVCAFVELRRNNRYDDPPLDSIALEPGTAVPMRPTDRHLRLVSLRRPLRPSESFPVILDFLIAGEVKIVAVVEAAPDG
jgi:periplasmic copper chaperone A